MQLPVYTSPFAKCTDIRRWSDFRLPTPAPSPLRSPPLPPPPRGDAPAEARSFEGAEGAAADPADRPSSRASKEAPEASGSSQSEDGTLLLIMSRSLAASASCSSTKPRRLSGVECESSCEKLPRGEAQLPLPSRCRHIELRPCMSASEGVAWKGRGTSEGGLTKDGTSKYERSTRSASKEFVETSKVLEIWPPEVVMEALTTLKPLR
mmetsp:Transcript_78267/g.254120  ORF Transcript_78267/g.254120 Transcript_78267/m.254120 type:complete len:208 (-) Transcript_78267:555-1178(-)